MNKVAAGIRIFLLKKNEVFKEKIVQVTRFDNAAVKK